MEVYRLNYTTGIGTPQEHFNATGTTASPEPSKTGKAELNPSSIGSQTASGGAARVDKANLSAAGSLVMQTLSESDVRAGKVTALQQSIVAGTYNISSSDVAAKLLDALLK
jgi:negative regulator of flagellin synthesis FlgM